MQTKTRWLSRNNFIQAGLWVCTSLIIGLTVFKYYSSATGWLMFGVFSLTLLVWSVLAYANSHLRQFPRLQQGLWHIPIVALVILSVTNLFVPGRVDLVLNCAVGGTMLFFTLVFRFKYQ